MPDITQIVDFLERYGALRVGESPWPIDSDYPRIIRDDEEVLRVNWDELLTAKSDDDQYVSFQNRRRYTVRDSAEWLADQHEPSSDVVGIFRGNLYVPDEVVQKIFTSLEDGSIRKHRLHPVFDICAWYQPIHFFGGKWGIYLREECLFQIARDIASFHPRSFTYGITASDFVRAAFFLLYLHENYHHKVECLGLRLNVVDRRSSYIPYMDLVYKRCIGTSNQLEETLANVDAFRRMNEYVDGRMHRIGAFPSSVLKATQQYMRFTCLHAPPGYKEAYNYFGKGKELFDQSENVLQVRVHEASLRPSQPDAEWDFAPRLMQSFFSIQSEIYTIVRKGSRPALPVT